METGRSLRPRGGGLSNIFKNLAWLVGGKGFAAVCSLIYLAVLARSLGLKDFGHFSLILGTGQALVAVAGFQTWQTMVRFGAIAVHEGDWLRFGRLAFLCGAIDVSGAIVGTVAAYVIYYGFGGALDLNERYIDMAFAFNCAMLWGRMTTPNGIVRVLGRFDVGSYVEALVPSLRLIASLVILVTGPSVGKFLFAWAAIDLLANLAYWLAARQLVPEALAAGNFGHWRQAVRENEGVVSFFGITYSSSTLDALAKQGPLLAVGYFFGTSAAGIYRLADQLAQSVGKFAQLITRAVFPEFVNARMSFTTEDFHRLFRQVTLIAGLGGLLVTGVAWLFGGILLELVGGEAFASGAPILLAVAIAASFELAAVSYEPMFYATGHPIYPLIVRGVALGVLLALILAVSGSGPTAVGWSVTAAQALGYALMSVTAWLVLRQIVAREGAGAR